ncbi:MAG TPA: RluA family pseudouridine synthase [Thermoleophilia bacterium]|nr:RluA family pseudouridine synthase [Thermoleophilia bacterium]
MLLEVASEEEGVRLDVFVGRHAAGSRSQAAALIDAGKVTVDGTARAKSFRLQAGQAVRLERADEGTPDPDATELLAEDIPVCVLYEDEWLLVVDKPAGMVVHPAKGHRSGTLVNALAGRGISGGEDFRPGIVHRLDRDTSGLMMVAKSPGVHRRLQEMIRAREIDRRYLALVHGDLANPSGTIEAPIGRDPVRRKTMTVGGSGSRSAVTHFRVLERLGDFTLIEARLETGRTHQIRVHFLAIGHPVAGDPVYARRDPLALGRQFLHSHSLRLSHPRTEEDLSVQSELPAELEEILGVLRRV